MTWLLAVRADSARISPPSCPARSQACADCVNLSALPDIHVLDAASKTAGSPAMTPDLWFDLSETSSKPSGCSFFTRRKRRLRAKVVKCGCDMRPPWGSTVSEHPLVSRFRSSHYCAAIVMTNSGDAVREGFATTLAPAGREYTRE